MLLLFCLIPKDTLVWYILDVSKCSIPCKRWFMTIDTYYPMGRLMISHIYIYIYIYI
jgi:hypothetical protein